MLQRKNVDLVKIAVNEDQVSAIVQQMESPSADTPGRLHWPAQFAANGGNSSGPRLDILRVAPET